MKNFMEGKKTYTALAIALIGVLGIAEYISPTEASTLIDNIFSIVGIVGAVYGRFVAKGL